MKATSETETDATVYTRLRERSVALAWVWALAEYGRIVFGITTFCGPGVVLVVLVFEASEQSLGHLARLFAAWQLYAAMFAAGAFPCATWQLAQRITRWIGRVLPENQDEACSTIKEQSGTASG